MRPDHVHYLPEGYILQGNLLYQEVANRDQRQQEKVSAAALIIKVIREKRHKQNTGRILTLQQGVYL